MSPLPFVRTGCWGFEGISDLNFCNSWRWARVCSNFSFGVNFLGAGGGTAAAFSEKLGFRCKVVGGCGSDFGSGWTGVSVGQVGHVGQELGTTASGMEPSTLAFVGGGVGCSSSAGVVAAAGGIEVVGFEELEEEEAKSVEA